MKKIAFFSLALVFLAAATAHGSPGETVKIAVASNDKNAASTVAALAGRSPCYLIFDKTGTLMEVIENPYRDERGGAGLATAHLLAEKAVTIVIAETFGGKMSNALKSKGIAYLEFKGTVSDAVKKALNPR